MANPAKVAAFNGHLRHMPLAPNRFVDAKRAVPPLVLAEYPRHPWSLPRVVATSGPTPWTAVLLKFERQNRTISATQGKERAFCAGAEAERLVADLDPTVRKRLEQGKLRANLTLEHLGGKNWKILAISPV
jgi:hypothetical protein